MNRKISVILIILSLFLCNVTIFAEPEEETVPPTIQVPSPSTSTDLPDLSSFLGGEETPEEPSQPQQPSNPSTPSTPSQPQAPEAKEDEDLPKEDKILEEIKSLKDSKDSSEEILTEVKVLIKEMERTNKTDLDSLLSLSKSLNTMIDSVEEELKGKIGQKIKREIVIESEDEDVSLPPLDEVFKTIDSVSIETNNAKVTIDKDSFFDGSKGVVLTVQWLKDSENNLDKDKNILELKLSNEKDSVKTFKKPITITVPYVLGDNQNPTQLTAFYIDESGRETLVPGIYSDGKFTFKTNHFSKFYIGENKVSFTDVSEESWSYDYIEFMSSKGIIKGMGQSIFNPQKVMSRAEFFAMLNRVLLYGDNLVTLPYEDVSTDAWYSQDVKTLYKSGLLDSLYEGSLLNPTSSITRNEVAALVGKTLLDDGYNEASETTLAAFKDSDDVTASNRKYVAMAVEYGLLNGYNEKLHPNDFLTREEGAAIIYRLFHK